MKIGDNDSCMVADNSSILSHAAFGGIKANEMSDIGADEKSF